MIELDGSQHMEDHAIGYDSIRSAYLEKLGLRVLRFNNLQVLNETESVLDVIYRFIHDRTSPPASVQKREETR